MGRLAKIAIPLLIFSLPFYMIFVYFPRAFHVVFIVSYLIISAATLYFSGKFASNITKHRSEAERINSEAAISHKSSTFSGKIEILSSKVSSFISKISTSLLWPINIFLGYILISNFQKKYSLDNRTSSLRLSLKPLEAYAIFGSTISAILLLMFTFMFKTSMILLFFTILVLSSVLLRLISYIAGPMNFPKALRMKTNHPYLIFLLLSSLEAITVLVTFHILRVYISNINLISLEEISYTFKTIFYVPSFVKLIIYPKQSGVFNVLSGFIGIILYSTIINNTVRLKEFSRTDDDYILLGNLRNQTGEFSEALKLLEKISPSLKNSSRVCEVRLTALCAIQQFHDAYKDALIASENEIPQHRITAPSLPLFTMGYSIEHCPSSALSRLNFFQYAKSQGLTDLEMSTLISNLIMDQNEESTDIASSLLDSGVFDHSHVTKSLLLIKLDDRITALETINKYSTNSPIDDLTKQRVMLIITISDPRTTLVQDQNNFDQWLKFNIGNIETTIINSSSFLDLMHLLGIVRDIILICDKFNHPYIERLKYLRGNISKKLKEILHKNSRIIFLINLLDEE